jgi:membrane-associated phospholipid phosphatase
LSISAMPKRTLIALLISFCLSISRIILLKHFMSDVLLGLFIGGYATKWVQVQMEKKNDSIFSKKLVSS